MIQIYNLAKTSLFVFNISKYTDIQFTFFFYYVDQWPLTKFTNDYEYKLSYLGIMNEVRLMKVYVNDMDIAIYTVQTPLRK